MEAMSIGMLALGIGEAVLAAALLWATWVMAQQTKQQTLQGERQLEAAEDARAWDETPQVVAYLEFNHRDETPTLSLKVENIGRGTAVDLRWWMENAEAAKKDLKKDLRNHLVKWPEGEEEAYKLDYLTPGGETGHGLAVTNEDEHGAYP